MVTHTLGSRGQTRNTDHKASGIGEWVLEANVVLEGIRGHNPGCEHHPCYPHFLKCIQKVILINLLWLGFLMVYVNLLCIICYNWTTINFKPVVLIELNHNHIGSSCVFLLMFCTVHSRGFKSVLKHNLYHAQHSKTMEHTLATI